MHILSIYILDFYQESSIIVSLGRVAKFIAMMNPSIKWLKQYGILTVSGE